MHNGEDTQEERATMGTPLPPEPQALPLIIGAVQPETLLTTDQVDKRREKCPPTLHQYFDKITFDQTMTRFIQQFQSGPAQGFFGQTPASVTIDDADITHFLLKKLLGLDARLSEIYDQNDLFKALIFLHKYFDALQSIPRSTGYSTLLTASYRWHGLADRLPFLLREIFSEQKVTSIKEICLFCVTAMNAGIQQTPPSEDEWGWAIKTLKDNLTADTAAGDTRTVALDTEGKKLAGGIPFHNAFFAALNRLSIAGVISNLSVTYSPKDTHSIKATVLRKGMSLQLQILDSSTSRSQKAVGEQSFAGNCIKFLDPSSDADKDTKITASFTVLNPTKLTPDLLEKPKSTCWAELLTEKGYKPEAIAETVTSQAAPVEDHKPETLPFAFSAKPSKSVVLGMAGNYIKKGGEITPATISCIRNKNSEALFEAIEKIATSDERKERIQSLFNHILQTRAVSPDGKKTIEDYLKTLSPNPAPPPAKAPRLS